MLPSSYACEYALLPLRTQDYMLLQTLTLIFSSGLAPEGVNFRTAEEDGEGQGDPERDWYIKGAGYVFFRFSLSNRVVFFLFDLSSAASVGGGR